MYLIPIHSTWEFPRNVEMMSLSFLWSRFDSAPRYGKLGSCTKLAWKFDAATTVKRWASLVTGKLHWYLRELDILLGWSPLLTSPRETNDIWPLKIGIPGKEKEPNRPPKQHFWVLGTGFTLPKTNSSPLEIGRNPKGNSSSNHPFSGTMLVSGMSVPFQFSVSIFASQISPGRETRWLPRLGWTLCIHAATTQGVQGPHFFVFLLRAVVRSVMGQVRSATWVPQCYCFVLHSLKLT